MLRHYLYGTGVHHESHMDLRINAAQVKSGDLPLDKYRFYVLLGNIVDPACSNLFTNEWWNSRDIIDNPIKCENHEDVSRFWMSWSMEEEDPDLWFNLPDIALGLLELLNLFKPGWNKKRNQATEAALKTRLVQEARALMHAIE